MPVDSDALEQLSGTVAIYRKISDSGRVIAMAFCAHCHGWLWNRPESAPGMAMLRASSFDNLDWAVPVDNIWTGCLGLSRPGNGQYAGAA
ncbi:MAG: GFA family protein [Candidatus Devosia symbiotica]|nr:GFA family protein [Candidatus Devosia symbiotica]